MWFPKPYIEFERLIDVWQVVRGYIEQEMERKIQQQEEINKVVKKLSGKNLDKSKRNGCSQRTTNKVVFVVEGIFLTTENAQQQEKLS